MQRAILVDTTKCTFCQQCIRACSIVHDSLFPGVYYTDVSLFAPGVTVDHPISVPTLCMHCDDPPCVKVCEGSALSKTAQGPVTWDRNRCIGCLSCTGVCPFDKSLHYQPATGHVFKCDMCFSRVNRGLLPGCVEVCHALGFDARSFGTFDEMLKKGKQRAAEVDGVLLYPQQTHVLMLFPREYYVQGLLKGWANFQPTYPGWTQTAAQITRYAHLAWLPFIGGLAYYVVHWRQVRMAQLVRVRWEEE